MQWYRKLLEQEAEEDRVGLTTNKPTAATVAAALVGTAYASAIMHPVTALTPQPVTSVTATSEVHHDGQTSADHCDDAAAEVSNRFAHCSLEKLVEMSESRAAEGDGLAASSDAVVMQSIAARPVLPSIHMLQPYSISNAESKGAMMPPSRESSPSPSLAHGSILLQTTASHDSRVSTPQQGTMTNDSSGVSSSTSSGDSPTEVTGLPLHVHHFFEQANKKRKLKQFRPAASPGASGLSYSGGAAATAAVAMGVPAYHGLGLSHVHGHGQQQFTRTVYGPSPNSSFTDPSALFFDNMSSSFASRPSGIMRALSHNSLEDHANFSEEAGAKRRKSSASAALMARRLQSPSGWLRGHSQAQMHHHQQAYRDPMSGIGGEDYGQYTSLDTFESAYSGHGGDYGHSPEELEGMRLRGSFQRNHSTSSLQLSAGIMGSYPRPYPSSGSLANLFMHQFDEADIAEHYDGYGRSSRSSSVNAPPPARKTEVDAAEALLGLRTGNSVDDFHELTGGDRAAPLTAGVTVTGVAVVVSEVEGADDDDHVMDSADSSTGLKRPTSCIF